jgi:hypothetical protein
MLLITHPCFAYFKPAKYYPEFKYRLFNLSEFSNEDSYAKPFSQPYEYLFLQHMKE